MADKARTVSSTQTHTSKMNFEKVKELMLQNVSKTKSKTFVQYTKERLKAYIKNPYSNIDNIFL